MSDTPETDKAGGFYDLDTAVDADFARKFERERDEARKEVECLKPIAIACTCGKYEHEIRQLRGEIERANKDNASLAGRLTACEHERDSLGAEVERIKADKARLDFCDTIIDIEPRGYALHFSVKESTTIRGAIDSAMKGDK